MINLLAHNKLNLKPNNIIRASPDSLTGQRAIVYFSIKLCLK